MRLDIVLRRPRSFHDLPLWIKTLLAPAACLTAGVAVVVSVFLGTTETDSRLAEVAGRTLPATAASAALLDRVDEVQLMAMRALVWQQAGVPKATIDALNNDIARGLKTLASGTAELAAGHADGDADTPILRRIATRSADHAKLLGEALDLIDDPAIAVGYFRRADAAFEALRGDIAALSVQRRNNEAASVEAARASSHTALVRSYWIFLASALVMAGLLPVVVAAICRPVRALTRTMTALVAGDMTAAVTGQHHRDELGDMARAVVVFKEHMILGNQHVAEREAAGRHAEAEKRAALVGMAERIEAETGTALRQIGIRTAALASAADAMDQSASRTGESARNATAAAGLALANARSVAGSAEELAASIQEISRQVSQSATVAGRAVIAGGETRVTIQALDQNVAQISAVAGIIAEIAARTNLLALNATIEAARAGDAGRGFAVVAAEVKALAVQTAGSTREIARHIDQVRSATAASVAAVLGIEQTIGEISAISSSIAAAVEQQGAATEEIAHNVAETANATNEMTSRTGDVAAEAGETGRQAADLRDNAGGLHASMEELRQSVIRVVRTATTEVDRRLNKRFDVDLGCRVTFEGETQTARVVNWSDTGAQVRGARAMPVGTRGMLDIDGVGLALPFTVRPADDDTLHVAFVPDEAAVARFAGTPARLAGRMAA